MAERNPKENPGKEGTPKEEGTKQTAYLAASLRLPTSYPLGAPSNDKAITNSGIIDNASALPPIPGYMVLNYFPTLGISSSDTSAVNRATDNEFNEVRSKISGTRPYAPSDLMIYRACVDGLRDLYHVVRRIYGIIGKYSATNLYRPRAALTAMGLDAKNWINNASKLYSWLLEHKESLVPYPTVPIGTISKRREVFNTYMYTDGSIESVQTYILNQRAFWSYEKVDNVKGITTRIMPATYEEFVEMWDDMISALRNSADVHIMTADIKRAFPETYVTALPATTEDYRVEYVELDAVKCAIMNATILGGNITTGGNEEGIVSAFRIVDDQGVIKCQPRFMTDLAGLSGSNAQVSLMLNHINSVSAEPSAEDILNHLRFKIVLKSEVDVDKKLSTEILAMGTEVIYSAYTVGFDSSGEIKSIPVSTYSICNVGDGSNKSWASASLYALDTVQALANFDWHPPVVLAFRANNSTGTTHIVEDVQNYIPISNEELTQIHEANLLAQFGF